MIDADITEPAFAPVVAVVVPPITFDPPIKVHPDIIHGGMVVTSAEIFSQDDPAYVRVAIFGDGRVISVPAVGDAANSIRVALVSPPRPVAAPVPDMLSRAQFVIAARRVLGLTDAVARSLIGRLPDAESRLTALDLWDNAGEFHRHNSVLLGLAQLGGYTEAKLDEVFRAGAAPDLY